jgi:UPF0716 protein FxsA
MLSYLRGALAFVFLVFPLVEIAVLIKVGEAIGFWPTMLLLLGAALLGFTVIREQGLSVVARAFDAMRDGRLPLEPMLDSYAVIAAGLLLIVPGLISDAIGLLLLIAPLRRWLIRRAVGDIYDHPLIAGQGPRTGSEQPVIDATYERHERDPE